MAGTSLYREVLISALGKKCAVCQSVKLVDVDYIVPLSEGGTNELSNLQLLCPEHARKRPADIKSPRVVDGPHSGLGRPRILKPGEHLPKKWLTVEETTAILRTAALHSRRDAGALTLYSYGLRRSEVVGSDTLPGIRRRDINTLKGTIWVRGKGDPRQIVKDRELAFPDDVMRLMSTLVLETPGPDDKVFPIDEVTIWRHLKQYAREAGILDWQKVHPHRLRAFFANDAKFNRGMDVEDVRQLMRHKTVTQTITYTGVMPPDYQARKMREISRSRIEDQQT